MNREAVPIGDDIESVKESRVDVDTRNEEEEEEEESLEVWIFTFEVIPKKSKNREERELEDFGNSVHTNWRGAFTNRVIMGFFWLHSPV